MAEFTSERTIVIAAPVESVYDYVSDFSRHVEWNHQPTEMTKITHGPVGIGSVFRTKEGPPRNTPWLMRMIFPLLGKLMGGTGYTEAEITALDRNRRVAWTATAPTKKGGLNAKAEWEIRLEAHDEGTRIIQRVHFQLLAKMVANMDSEKLSQQCGEEMAINLAYLKTVLETQSAQSGAANRPAFA
jgi:uncharacterized protein YndB with AHSA1/START domain